METKKLTNRECEKVLSKYNIGVFCAKGKDEFWKESESLYDEKEAYRYCADYLMSVVHDKDITIQGLQKEKMEVYKCGTRATLVHVEMPCIITAAEIRYNNLSYQVSYWKNDELKTCWVNEQELIFDNIEKSKIGFKP